MASTESLGGAQQHRRTIFSNLASANVAPPKGLEFAQKTSQNVTRKNSNYIKKTKL